MSDQAFDMTGRVFRSTSRPTCEEQAALYLRMRFVELTREEKDLVKAVLYAMDLAEAHQVTFDQALQEMNTTFNVFKYELNFARNLFRELQGDPDPEDLKRERLTGE